MENKIYFNSNGFKIEGMLDKINKARGVVVTHPHPLYGGSMNNQVVESIVSAYRKNEFTTLRFNFRGVGESSGIYDNGIGEQLDVLSAVSYLDEIGIKRIDLAGYSFGSWVNAQLDLKKFSAGEMVLVSPPVGFLDFSSIDSIPCLKLVITGGKDEIAPADMIKSMAYKWNKDARIEIIKGAGHFFTGSFDKLESIISSYLQEH